MTISNRLLTAVGTLALSALCPQVASAQCFLPALKLLWSYPADGDTNVPTNAALRAIHTCPYPSIRTINGLPIGDGTFNPDGGTGTDGSSLGQLEPNHDYVIRLECPGPDGSLTTRDAGAADAGSDAGASSNVLVISFRTGASEAAPLPAAPVTDIEFAAEVESATCPEIVRAEGCYDTGPDVLVTFDVTSAGAIGWDVDGALWPARCGNPSRYVRAWPLTGRCFDIQPIGPGGLLGNSTHYCPPSLYTPLVDAGVGFYPMGSVFDASVPRFDAGAPRFDGGDDQEGVTGTQQNHNDGSCSAVAGSSSNGGLAWMLSSLAAVLGARRRRSSRR